MEALSKFALIGERERERDTMKLESVTLFRHRESLYASLGHQVIEVKINTISERFNDSDTLTSRRGLFLL